MRWSKEVDTHKLKKGLEQKLGELQEKRRGRRAHKALRNREIGLTFTELY